MARNYVKIIKTSKIASSLSLKQAILKHLNFVISCWNNSSRVLT